MIEEIEVSVKKYKTSDGKVFDKEEDADDHEFYLTQKGELKKYELGKIDCSKVNDTGVVEMLLNLSPMLIGRDYTYYLVNNKKEAEELTDLLSTNLRKYEYTEMRDNYPLIVAYDSRTHHIFTLRRLIETKSLLDKEYNNMIECIKSLQEAKQNG